MTLTRRRFLLGSAATLGAAALAPVVGWPEAPGAPVVRAPIGIPPVERLVVGRPMLFWRNRTTVPRDIGLAFGSGNLLMRRTLLPDEAVMFHLSPEMLEDMALDALADEGVTFRTEHTLEGELFSLEDKI